MNSGRRGFSLIEILITLVFVSFAFLPIYNLFRFGTRGTATTEREVLCTNHASDLANLFRELSVTQVEQCFPSLTSGGQETSLPDDSQILNAVKAAFPTPPDFLTTLPPNFERSMHIKRLDGGRPGIFGGFADAWQHRSKVPTFIITVTVKSKGSTQKTNIGDDSVTLVTLVMD